jgi:hypothetical protein
MKTTEGYQLSMTNHANDQIATKGFSEDKVKRVFANPAKVYPCGKKYPGQVRVVGKGLCLVGIPRNDGIFTLITVYRDRVKTAPRPDQLDTPEGREYASRYQAGLVRAGEEKAIEG